MSAVSVDALVRVVEDRTANFFAGRLGVVSEGPKCLAGLCYWGVRLNGDYMDRWFVDSELEVVETSGVVRIPEYAEPTV